MVSHADGLAPQFVNNGGDYSARANYQQHPNKDGYGSVEERRPTISVSHPVPDVEILRARKHIAVLFHDANKDQWEESSFPNDGSVLYDLAILDIAADVLEIQGINPSENNEALRRLKLLLLRDAREPENTQEFYLHVKNSDPVLEVLDFDGPSDFFSYGHFRRIEKKLRNESYLASGLLERACEQAVYAVFRNGVVPPQSVIDEYGFAEVGAPTSDTEKKEDTKVEPPVSEWHLDRPHTKTALKNWIHVLAETLDPLTFGRSDPKYDILDFIALLGKSALVDGGLQNAARVSDWDHDRTNIPQGSGLPKWISTLDRGGFLTQGVPAINQQFDAVHQNLLKLADELGFFTDSVSLAVDLYRIEWHGSENEMTINRLPKAENEVESEFIFVVVGILDKEARFTLGTRFLPSKDLYPQRLREILDGTLEYIDVEEMYADAEMVSGELLETLWNIVGSDYIVSAPDKGVAANLQKATPTNYVGYVPSISWNCSPKPNLVAYPKDPNTSDPPIVQFSPQQLKGDFPSSLLTSQRSLTRDSSDNSQEMGNAPPPILKEFDDPTSAPGFGTASGHPTYITGRKLPDRSAAGIRLSYFDRWAIEQSINQISNHFLPTINSPDPKQRLYGVNTAILLQNWHTLINRSVSPDPWHRVDCTNQDLLKAIQTVAVQRHTNSKEDAVEFDIS